jgi:hypothetical protein
VFTAATRPVFVVAGEVEEHLALGLVGDAVELGLRRDPSDQVLADRGEREDVLLIDVEQDLGILAGERQ